MPRYHIERQVRINAPITKVTPAIEDFNTWPIWSPWLCMEPDAHITYQGKAGENGHSYQWAGEMVGAGGMELTQVSNHDGDLTYDMALNFIKPFKSKAQVRFIVTEAEPDSTEVSWHMDGKLPFFLFFMLKPMTAMISSDYDRGLKMLKAYVETGVIHSSIDIEGIIQNNGFSYVGVSAHSEMADLGSSMSTTLPQAFALANSNNLAMTGAPGAVYHHIDIIKQRCHYSAAVPVDSTQGLPAENTGTIQSGRAIRVIHTGSYQYLGNAWSTAMSYQRYHRLKLDKKRDPYELYLNSPEETPEAELITEIYVPIKG